MPEIKSYVGDNTSSIIQGKSRNLLVYPDIEGRELVVPVMDSKRLEYVLYVSLQEEKDNKTVISLELQYPFSYRDGHSEESNPADLGSFLDSLYEIMMEKIDASAPNLKSISLRRIKRFQPEDSNGNVECTKQGLKSSLRGLAGLDSKV